MADRSSRSSSNFCCRLPPIPLKWILFVDFAFTFGTTIVYFADIVTDIITLKMYYENEWYNAFGLSIGFIVAPSILLAILECQFLIKTYGKNVKWSTVVLRTVLNVPFQLTVIWYHIKLSYSYLKTWLDHIREKDENKTKVTERQMSVSNLADIDDRLGTMGRGVITSTEVPAASDNGFSGIAYPAQCDHTWWKQLTKEQWLSHLNKMKLTESMLESLPQLLINLYLIVKYPNTSAIQYLSATLSYLSLCGGIVRFDKTRKDNEAERLMVDRTLLHSRAFVTRLEWPQMFFVSLYKGCYLAARILAFVYFTVYFSWYVLILIIIHWALLMAYLVYLWYPTDIHKKTRQLVQADYKFRAYMFLSQDIMGVFHNSLMGIFINVRPHHYAFLGQPYCYLFWFYLVYVIENIILFLLPGVVFSLRDQEAALHQHQYYVVLIVELCLNVLGTIFCVVYYFLFHKMRTYTRNAYPVVPKMQSLCCCGRDNEISKVWTVCKQAETSEIFYLRREKLKEYKNSYNTVVRANRKSGRNLECFVDDRGKIFYARRSKLFRKIPTLEEEERVEMRREVSRESLDNLDTEPLVAKEPKGRESYRESETVPKSELAFREDSPVQESKDTDNLLSFQEKTEVSEVERQGLDMGEPQNEPLSREKVVSQSSRSKRSDPGTRDLGSSPGRRSQRSERSPAHSQTSSTKRSNQEHIAPRPGTPPERGSSQRSSKQSARPPSKNQGSETKEMETPPERQTSERSFKKSPRSSSSRSSRNERDSGSKRSTERSRDRPGHSSSSNRESRRSDTPPSQRSSRSNRKLSSPSSQRSKRENSDPHTSRSRSPCEKDRFTDRNSRGEESKVREKPVGQTWI